MRLSSPDRNTSVAWGLKSSQALGACVVWGRTSVFSLSRVQVNMKMEGQFMVTGGPQAQECPALNLPEKLGAPMAQEPTRYEQLCLY